MRLGISTARLLSVSTRRGTRSTSRRRIQLSPGDVENLGFDPTGEYWWWNVTCWRDGGAAHALSSRSR